MVWVHNRLFRTLLAPFCQCVYAYEEIAKLTTAEQFRANPSTPEHQIELHGTLRQTGSSTALSLVAKLAACIPAFSDSNQMPLVRSMNKDHVDS
eukprot:6237229-Amphidinium_carterae.1